MNKEGSTAILEYFFHIPLEKLRMRESYIWEIIDFKNKYHVDDYEYRQFIIDAQERRKEG